MTVGTSLTSVEEAAVPAELVQLSVNKVAWIMGLVVSPDPEVQVVPKPDHVVPNIPWRAFDGLAVMPHEVPAARLAIDQLSNTVLPGWTRDGVALNGVIAVNTPPCEFTQLLVDGAYVPPLVHKQVGYVPLAPPLDAVEHSGFPHALVAEL
jgi:hypothetical protein